MAVWYDATPNSTLSILIIALFYTAELKVEYLLAGLIPLAVMLGIAAGLFIGKQIGVFGFTMSLFIGGLSFNAPTLAADVRLGVLAGSTLSAILGYVLLRRARDARLADMDGEVQPAE